MALGLALESAGISMSSQSCVVAVRALCGCWMEDLTVTLVGGNNLIIWGCMGWNGIEKLVEVEGKMNAEQYCEILEYGMVESFGKLEMEEEERIFQQDNDPKHTSKRAKKMV